MTTFTPDPTGTVVLCGSVTRAVAALDAAEHHYLALGRTVRKPVKDDTKSAEEHAAHWYALIDACGPDDLVVICCPPGQDLGEQTTREMDRALDGGKRVEHWRSEVTRATRQWTAEDCICNESDDCYGDPDQEISLDSPWYRFCPYCHYVDGLCPGRKERSS